MTSTRVKIKAVMLFAVLTAVSCVQQLPKVNVNLKTYNYVENSWEELPSDINSKEYLYGQSFSATVDSDFFFIERGPVDEDRPELGNYIDRYSFDGKTWSISPVLGKQEPFTGKLTNETTTLYAYYTKQTIPEKDFEYSWILVDRASFITGVPNVDFGFSDSDKSENAELTLLDNKSVMQDGVFYRVESSEVAGGFKNTYYPLYTGQTKRVTAPVNLTRHGYKFAGWSKSASSNSAVYPPQATFELSASDAYLKGGTERVTVLYAVWEIDSANKYYALTDLTRGGDLSFPVYYDIRDEENPSLYKNYPYYNEILMPSKDYTVPLSVYSGADKRKLYKFDYDFAVAELPLSANILNELNKWNDKYNYGYSLPSPFDGGISASQLSEIPSSTEAEQIALWDDKKQDVNKVFFGSQKSGSDYISKPGSVSSRQSTNRTDMVVGVSLAQAIVICNALTEYYNRNSDSQFINLLTPAYTNTIGGKTIKTITEAVKLIEEKGAYEPLHNIINGQMPTGFRLPTNAEWEFAASVIPQNDWSNEDVCSSYQVGENENDRYKGSSFPQFQKIDQPSGVAISVSPVQNEDLLKKFCFYSGNISSSAGFAVSETLNGTKAHILTTNSNKANVKAMSGNIYEWTGDVSGEKSDENPLLSLFYRRGGSYNGEAKDMAIGRISGKSTYKDHAKLYDTGFRTVRTVTSSR